MNIVKTIQYKGQKINLLGDEKLGFILDSPFIDGVFKNADEAESGFQKFIDENDEHHPECHGKRCDCFVNPKLLAYK